MIVLYDCYMIVQYDIGFLFFQQLFRSGTTFHLALRRLTVSVEGFKLKLKEHTIVLDLLSRNLTLA